MTHPPTRAILGAAALAILPAAVLGQAPHADPGPHFTPDHPASDFREYAVDSGLLGGGGVFRETVHVEDASWMRLHFSAVELDPGGIVRVTSVLDAETQVLDAAALAAWGHTTAYFNGDTVTVELVAAPGTTRNRIAIEQVEVNVPEAVPVGGANSCGICGPTDDRVPSNETWIARLLPAGCTASVFTDDSCMVTAGHCLGGNMVVQFNVPNSDSNCSLNHPPVNDQFPADTIDGVAGGPGNDWGVLETGTNGQGQKPFDRYGELRPLAPSAAQQGDPVVLTGYGVDQTCITSQTQQTASGTICSVLADRYNFDVDLRGGNSGSSLTSNGEIIGIATHCPCCNIAQRIDLTTFSNVLLQCANSPIATGPTEIADGFLSMSPDAYGSWYQPLGGVAFNQDLFNPVGPEPEQAAVYTSGFYLFVGGTHRELLSNSEIWDIFVNAEDDETLSRSITSQVVSSDTTLDGVDDTLVSAFRVQGDGVDLSFDVLQQVEAVTTVGAGDVAVLTQEYTITNDTGSAIDFELVRSYDGNLEWSGDFTDDTVGTDTNGAPVETFVYMEEPGDPATAITLSSPQADAYYGGKFGVDPDGAGGGPAYGLGTFFTIWDNFGLPATWADHVAGVGYDTNGNSGSAPPGADASPDGFIGLRIPVSLGPGANTTITVRHTYGARTPSGQTLPDCPWDCGDFNGTVGTPDFLTLLGEWGNTGPCDVDGGGIGTTDFLALLGNWGPCP